MYIKVSSGGNSTQTALDLTNIEQWRVSLGPRAVQQSSTAGTMQDARNAFGTLPLSLTLMVRGGSKEKNRALCSRIISRLQGKVEIGELKGYEDLVFIGNVKNYTIGEQAARWCTMTLVIDCEKWITDNMPVVMTGGSVEYDIDDPITMEAPNLTTLHIARTLMEKRTGVYAGMPGILPTPISFRLTTSEILDLFSITATSDDTPENNWTIELRDFPARYDGHDVVFDLTAPFPDSDGVFDFALWYNAASPSIPVIVKLDPDGIVTKITKWPVYAGGTMHLNIACRASYDGPADVTLTFNVPALQAL